MGEMRWNVEGGVRNGVCLCSYTLVAEESVAGDLFKNLVDAGAVPIGEESWEVMRVMQGRPTRANELIKALNPFEVDLFHAVSLDKGCFLGQESIARVYTRDAIRKRLWGMEFPSDSRHIALGDIVRFDGRDVGFISTASVEHPSRPVHLALGFLNAKVQKMGVQWEGKEVEVAGIRGVVKALPYMTFDFPDGIGAPRSSTSPSDQVDLDQKDQSKEERLQAMQARLDAFMAQQKNQ